MDASRRGNMKNTMLTKKQLLQLFYASVDNALALFNVVFENYKNEKKSHIALGISELSLE
jgi:hypothetical protein